VKMSTARRQSNTTLVHQSGEGPLAMRLVTEREKTQT